MEGVCTGEIAVPLTYKGLGVGAWGRGKGL